MNEKLIGDWKKILCLKFTFFENFLLAAVMLMDHLAGQNRFIFSLFKRYIIIFNIIIIIITNSSIRLLYEHIFYFFFGIILFSLIYYNFFIFYLFVCFPPKTLKWTYLWRKYTKNTETKYLKIKKIIKYKKKLLVITYSFDSVSQNSRWENVRSIFFFFWGGGCFFF